MTHEPEGRAFFQREVSLKGGWVWDHRRMIVTLKTQGLQSMEQIRAFLEGTQPLDFDAPDRKARYHWISGELRRLGYLRLGKADKGLVRRYLEKVSGNRKINPALALR